MAWQGQFAFGGDDEDEDEENETFMSVFSSRDGAVLLIDWRSSHRSMCLKACKRLLQHQAVSCSRDLSAIVLYGCSKTTAAEMPNISVLQSLQSVGADRVKELRRLARLDADEVVKEYPVEADANMSDALWTCQSLFASSTTKLGSRRILFMTDEDSPHSTEGHRRQQLRTKIMDLSPTGIDLMILPLVTGSQQFKANSFYCDNLLPDESVCGEGFSSSDQLVLAVEAHISSPRCVVRIPLMLPGNVSCSVSVHKLAYKAAVPTAVRLSRDSNLETKSTRRFYLEETAELLLNTDLKKAVVLSGKKVTFETEEVGQMKQLESPGLRVLAFYDLTKLKPHFRVKGSSFIRPDERGVQGSICFISALLLTCLKQKKFALCSCTARSGSAPALVALVPQEEVKDELGRQLAPDGFHLVPLPYADDFRKLKLESLVKADEEHTAAAKVLIQQFVEPRWRPQNHHNPSLQLHWAHVEALALDKDSVAQPEDSTRMSERVLQNGAKRVKEFMAVCSLDGLSAKKAKPEVDIEALAKNDSLDRLTVPILKDAVNDLKLKPASLRKADLITAIRKHFGK